MTRVADGNAGSFMSDAISDTVRVSTTFLGMEIGDVLREKKLQLFETAIIEHEDYEHRLYSATRAEAEQTHRVAVALARLAVKRGVPIRVPDEGGETACT